MTKYFMFYFLSFIFTVIGLQNSSINSDLTSQNVDVEPKFDNIIINVTFTIGKDAVLTCSVQNLGNFKVGWLRASDQTVLALNDHVVTLNTRITVGQENMHTWYLRIRQLRESDRGCYMCQINSSPMKKQIGCIDVQVPPDIINEESSADIAVQESDDTILTCRATGNPIPRIMWRREDGNFIIIKKQGGRDIHKVESYNGTSLQLIRLERKQMGAYLCIATNDIPPSVSKRVLLSVHFSPTVQAPSQLLGTPFGSNVQLECNYEASPAPVTYWLKGGRLPINDFPDSYNSDNIKTRPEMLLDGPKYGISEQRISYRGTMRLLVRNFALGDIGTYHCICTNSLGRAEGTMRLYELKLHPDEDDQTNVIEGLAEAARGKANSSTCTLCIENFITMNILNISLYLTEMFIQHAVISR